MDAMFDLAPEEIEIISKTVCVDFDGVIHRYSEGWKDGSIYDFPVPGALDALRYLLDNYSVVIHTSRTPQQVCEWLRGYAFNAMPDVARMETGSEGLFWDNPGVILVTRMKYAAIAYIDDRGIRFENWMQALEDLQRHTFAI